ncbi:MAG TPA: DUF4129 domain-containing protein [Terracidiphilus sp.]
MKLGDESKFAVTHPCAGRKALAARLKSRPYAQMPAVLRFLASGAFLAVIVAGGAGLLLAQVVPPNPEPAADWRQVSLEEYRAHLQNLETLTAACAKARNPAACDPGQVGSDDGVPFGAKDERRQVRFGWLRALFLRAQKPDEKPREPTVAEKAQADLDPDEKAEQDAAKAEVRTTPQLLEDAQTRLAFDLKQAGGTAEGAAQHSNERKVLQQVLAGREFQHLQQAPKGPSPLEKFGNWLNSLFEWLGRQNVSAAWVGKLLIWGFILAVAVGLVWGLLQMERRWRVKLVPDNDGPAPTAASARDWQLWLKDAREAAARGEWREAIHFLYWAAISRLESKKLWPADRARTPREYLALVAIDDPRKAGLGALTREFEWTWYGGRAAEETHYRHAEELATGLFESRGQAGGQTR